MAPDRIIPIADFKQTTSSSPVGFLQSGRAAKWFYDRLRSMVSPFTSQPQPTSTLTSRIRSSAQINAITPPV